MHILSKLQTQEGVRSDLIALVLLLSFFVSPIYFHTDLFPFEFYVPVFKYILFAVFFSVFLLCTEFSYYRSSTFILFVTLIILGIVSSSITSAIDIKNVLTLMYIASMLGAISSNNNSVPKILNNDRIVPLVAVILYLVVPVLIGYRCEYLLKYGMGNGNINFSIWLVQFGILVAYWLDSRRYKKNIKGLTLFMFYPILFLQVILAGRTGFVASCLLLIFIMIRQHRSLLYDTLVALCVILTYKYCTIMISNDYYSYSVIDRFIYRDDVVATNFIDYISKAFNRYSLGNGIELGLGEYTKHYIIDFLNNFWHAIDRIFSYRLSTTLIFLEKMSLETLLYGVGQSARYIDDSNAGRVSPHNAFVNMVYAFGICYAIVASFIYIRPFIYRCKNKSDLPYFVWFIGILISIIQPEFFVTQFSTSIVYWMIYPYIVPISESV